MVKSGLFSFSARCVRDAKSAERNILVNPIFLGKLDHRFKVFVLGFIEPETTVNDETAAMAHDVDQLSDAVFYLTGRTGKKS